jgi:hypothetical protein
MSFKRHADMNSDARPASISIDNNKETDMKHTHPRTRVRHFPSKVALLVAVEAALAATGAHAGEIDTGNADVKVRWDNTLKYSAAARAKEQSASLITGADAVNADDGDRNFHRGLISNRVDLLSELDVTYRQVGARVSGAAWYDTVYNRDTANNSPFTYNALSVPYTRFPEGTRNLHGRRGELLDAFVFVKGDIADMPGILRVGRHALVYGETLFFGSNGIANAQQPIDVVKVLSVPNTQFKELVRPVSQVSGQLQLGSSVTVGGYYQLRWEESVLPGSGSYFNSLDVFPVGGERLFTGPTSAFTRAPDLKPRNSGQGGVQLKWSPTGANVDLGFYAARYHDKSPELVVSPGTQTFRWTYGEDVKTYGISASTTFGDFNVAGEASVRRNTPLVSSGSADLFRVVPAAFGGPAAPSDNNANPAYPVGNSAHFNLSTLASISPNAIARESTLLAELAWNRLTSVTRNPAQLDANAERNAWGVRVLYTPSYRQVVNGLDIDVPFGFSYFPKGKSAVITAFGVDKGGDMSIGVNGGYLNEWFMSLGYTHYYGAEGTAAVAHGAGTMFTFKQNFKDRDYVSVSVRRTF